MKIIKEYEVSMPDYALCYIVNADSSGLTDEDKTTIDNALQPYYDEADKIDGYVEFCFDFDKQPDPYFTWHPLYGLASNCYDCKILILINESSYTDK